MNQAFYSSKEYRKRYTGIYGSWYAIKQRCKNPNNKQFKDYGGRGITYPEKWEGFMGFREDIGATYKKGLIIDRVDVDKSYSKENCRWVTRKESSRNKRKHVRVEYQGKKMILVEYAELTGMNYGTLKSRYNRGMTIQETMRPSLYRPAKINK